MVKIEKQFNGSILFYAKDQHKAGLFFCLSNLKHKFNFCIAIFFKLNLCVLLSADKQMN